jgi:hypothetical protein
VREVLALMRPAPQNSLISKGLPMMTPSDNKATLSFSDGSPSMELPIYKGSIGPM